MSRDEIIMYLKECIFDGELSENNLYSKVMNFLPKNVEVQTGVTKMALFFPNTDFVVKIPFNGVTQHHCEWNNEAQQYEETEEPTFVPFEFAETKDEADNWNYCQVEVELYEEAVHDNVNQFFLETELLTVINDNPIYIQQKAEILAECKDTDYYEDSYDEDTLSETRKKCKDKDLRCFNACWLSDAFSYYKNDDKVFDLLVFAENYLEDLHSHNLGYVNGRPVIVDYAGYHEED